MRSPLFSNIAGIRSQTHPTIVTTLLEAMSTEEAIGLTRRLTEASKDADLHQLVARVREGLIAVQQAENARN